MPQEIGFTATFFTFASSQAGRIKLLYTRLVKRMGRPRSLYSLRGAQSGIAKDQLFEVVTGSSFSAVDVNVNFPYIQLPERYFSAEVSPYFVADS